MTDVGERSSWFEGRRGPALRLLTMLVAPLVVFGWTFIANGFTDNGDDLLANLPELLHSARMALSGEILWTPSLWMGMPLLAEPEFATLYPPHFLLLLGPPLIAFTIYVLAHYVIAELGFYRYARVLGVSPAGALFGALAYAFTGFMLGHRGHTMYVVAGAWAPFVLASTELFARHRRRRDALIGALAFAMLPLAGAVQLTVYLGGLVLVLAALRAWFSRSLRTLVASLVCIVPGSLFACVQVVPMLEYAAKLSTGDRATYEFATTLSFPPWLISTLYLPAPPLASELYSRIGVIALVLAIISMRAWKTASETERAFTVVFLGALVLMFGRYVPPVARLLHALPIVDVIRGPARHNFELGIAASVLASFGYDRMRDVVVSSARRWWIAGASTGAVGLLLVWLAPGDHADAPDSRIIPAAAIFAFLVLAVRLEHGRWRRRAWSLLAIGPMLVAGYSFQSSPRHFGDHYGMIAAARRALPQTLDTVRVLPPPLQATASIDALAGNSILFQPGAETLQGYSSIAYRDARQVLALDQFGQIDVGSPLAWTPLPTLYSVTHLVLPWIACGNANVALSGGSPVCMGPGKSVTVAPGKIAECRTDDLGASFRFALDATARSPSPDAAGAVVRLASAVDAETRELVISRTQLSPKPALFEKSVDLTKTSSLMFFWIESESTAPLELAGVRLRVQRARHLLQLAEGATLVHAKTVENGIRLEPDGALSSATIPLGGIDRPKRATLSFDARADAATTSDVVVDLYSPDGYDPDEAQIVAPGGSLSGDSRHFSRVVDMHAAPPDALFRAFMAGTGAVELRHVRLTTDDTDSVWDFPVRARHYGRNVENDGDKLVLGPMGYTAAGVNLPFRALTLDLDADVPRGAQLLLGSEPEPEARDMHSQHILLFKNGEHVRRTRVSLISPDVDRIRLFLVNKGDQPVTVDRLTLHDACVDRGYDEPRRLAAGFYLYRNPAALPRAYTVARVLRVSTPREARERMLSFSAAEIGHVATLDADAPADLASGSVVSREASPRRITVTVDAPAGPTLLVDNQRFDRAWRATIDGAPAEIHRANGIVRGVIVPRGRHVVVFAYQVPRALWLGLGLAILGVVALIPAPWLARRFHAEPDDGASGS